MKKSLILIMATLSVLSFNTSAIFADTDGKIVKTKELKNGNTLTVKKRGKIDDEGNVYKKRGFKVEDPDGELVRRGKNKSVKYVDGSQKRKQVREIHKDDGSVVQKRRRGMTDGEGNRKGNAQRRKLDADGNVVALQRARGKRNSDGSQVRQKQSQRKLENGSVAEKRVFKKKTATGKKVRVTKARKKG